MATDLGNAEELMSFYHIVEPATAEDDGSAWEYIQCEACGAPRRRQARGLSVRLLSARRKVHVVDSGAILVAKSLVRELPALDLEVDSRPLRVLDTKENLVQLMASATVHLAFSKKPCGCPKSFPKPWALEGPIPSAGLATVEENPRIQLVSAAVRDAMEGWQPDIVFEKVGESARTRSGPAPGRPDVARIVMDRLNQLPAAQRTKARIDLLRDEVALELNVKIPSKKN